MSVWQVEGLLSVLGAAIVPLCEVILHVFLELLVQLGAVPEHNVGVMPFLGICSDLVLLGCVKAGKAVIMDFSGRPV